MQKKYLPFVTYFILLLCYSIFSYSLTAPNLILSSWQPYWKFQLYMWETFFNNRQLLSQSFFILVLALWVNFYFIFKSKLLRQLSTATYLKVVFLLSLPLLFASNALSYDIFNYIFNAKMIVVYGANPHSQVALDFAYDDWVRFMHNTHTPAPYGYGWTALSLIPFMFGLKKLILTWFSFRFFNYLSYLGLAATAIKFGKVKNLAHLSLVLLNPLMLIEIVGNSHNDLWMLVPAIISILIIAEAKKLKPVQIFASLILLALSISIKLATLALLPIWLALVFLKFKPFFIKQKLPQLINDYYPLLASILLFLPLFTARSKQFLPWYLSWSLVWVMFYKTGFSNKINQWQNFWQTFLIAFSFSALYRYLPYLANGEYTTQVESNQLIITWGLGITLAVLMTLSNKFLSSSK